MKIITGIHIIFIISFTIYFVLSYFSRRLKFRNLMEAIRYPKKMLLLNLKQLSGIFLFGLIPVSAYFTGLSFYRSFSEIHWIIFPAFISCCFLVGWLANNSAARVRPYVNAHSSQGLQSIMSYFIIRFGFLVSYEYFFRGVLFYLFLTEFGLWPSIIIITALYVLIHAFDSVEEIIGAIPFGIVLCLFSFFGGLWMAIVLHLILSFSYEIKVFSKRTQFKKLQL